MALKLPLKNGSHLLKSQEPSPSPNPLFFIPFYGLIIYAINSPFHFYGYGKSREILDPNDRHAPCTPSHAVQHDELPTSLRLATSFVNLAPKLGQLQK
jgi:hypothetical protein